MSKDTSPIKASTQALSSLVEQGDHFVEQIRKADLTAVEVRASEPQQLVLALNLLGRESLLDYLDQLSPPQYSAVLNASLWKTDELEVSELLDWLLFIDEEESLEPLELFLRSADEGLLQLLIRYCVEAISYDEATDVPPGKGWFTPDRGQLWIRILCKEEAEYRIVGRLLAYWFQRSPAIFYNALAIAGTKTQTELQEEAFQATQKQRQAMGLSSLEEVKLFHETAIWGQVERHFSAGSKSPLVSSSELSVRDPLEVSAVFDDLVAGLEADRLASELSNLLNAALIYQRFYSDEPISLRAIGAFVSGTLLLGLERLLSAEIEPFKCIDKFGFAVLYRIGFELLFELQKMSQRLSDSLPDESEVTAYSPISEKSVFGLLSDVLVGGMLLSFKKPLPQYRWLLDNEVPVAYANLIKKEYKLGGEVSLSFEQPFTSLVEVTNSKALVEFLSAVFAKNK